MRALSLFSFAAAVAFTASATAFAAPAPAPAAGADANVNTSEVQIVARTYKLRPVEFNGVQGAYNLADGSTLHVSADGKRLVSAIGDAAPSELLPVAENTFVSSATGARIVFDQIPFATSVSVSAPAAK